jgi:hypothetical protein
MEENLKERREEIDKNKDKEKTRNRRNKKYKEINK